MQANDKEIKVLQKEIDRLKEVNDKQENKAEKEQKEQIEDKNKTVTEHPEKNKLEQKYCETAESLSIEENCQNTNVKCPIPTTNRYEALSSYVEESDINLSCESYRKYTKSD